MTIWKTKNLSANEGDAVTYSTDWEGAEKIYKLMANLRNEPEPELESKSVDLYAMAQDDLFNGIGRNDFTEAEAREFLDDLTPEEYARHYMESDCCLVVNIDHHLDTKTTLAIYDELVDAFKDAYEALIAAGKEYDKENADA